MKRFTKLLALGLAAVMTFGMTAQAKVSVNTGSSNAAGNGFTSNVDWSNATVQTESGQPVDVKVLDEAQVEQAKDAVTSPVVDAVVKAELGDKFQVQEVVTGFDVDVPKGETVNVSIPVAGLEAGATYVVLHYAYGTDKAPEVITVSVVNGVVNFTVKAGSPFVLVKVGEEVEEETPTPSPTPVPTPNPNVVYTEVDGVWFMAWQGGADDFTVEQVEVSQGFIFSSETDAAVKEAMGDKFRVTDNVLAAFNFYAKDANGTPVEVWSPKFELDHKYVLVYYVNGLNEEPQVIELDVNNNYESYFNAMSGGAYYYCYIVEVVAEDRPAGVPGNSDNVNDASVPTAGAPGTSPKTGETLPMAGVMALILMAGAALCAVKVRYNK